MNARQGLSLIHRRMIFPIRGFSVGGSESTSVILSSGLIIGPEAPVSLDGSRA